MGYKTCYVGCISTVAVLADIFCRVPVLHKTNINSFFFLIPTPLSRISKRYNKFTLCHRLMNIVLCVEINNVSD
jgi:hypothetical protein